MSKDDRKPVKLEPMVMRMIVFGDGRPNLFQWEHEDVYEYWGWTWTPVKWGSAR